MQSLIIGTGFLGEQLYSDLMAEHKEVLTTYHQHKKYGDSIQFDFFEDSFYETFGKENIDVVFLPAKIEFIEDSNLLKKKMVEFVKWIGDKRLIYVSSDGIFDGKKGNYIETDIAHPVTLYGRNLKICEDIIREKAHNYCIIRPNYLYGFVSGNLDGRLGKAKDEALTGHTIIRFDDMYKSPLSYKQASDFILKIAFSEFVGTVHISGPRVSVYEFTRSGMEALGLPLITLKKDTMPKDKPQDFLADTSLDSHLSEQITHQKSLGIQESFKKFYSDKIIT